MGKVVILIIILAVFFLMMGSVSAWDSTNWWYQKNITINNIASQTLEVGYTVEIEFDHSSLVTSGKSLVNGGDVRVTWYNSSSSKQVELDRINFAGWNRRNTRIAFRIQENISPGGSDSNYYIYYGNPNAGNPPTNEGNVYWFYDDFNRANGEVVGNGWIESEHEHMPVGISNNRLRFQITGTPTPYEDNSRHSRIFRKNTFGSTNYKITYDIEFDGAGTVFGFSTWYIGLADSTGEIFPRIFHRYFDDVSNFWRGHFFYAGGADGSGSENSESYSGNATLLRIGTNCKWYENGVLRRDVTDSTTNDTWSFKVGCYSTYSSNVNEDCFNNVYIDNFIVKKHISLEPTSTLGTEASKTLLVIHSPQNSTYTKSNVFLSVSANVNIFRWLYNLDGGANVTFEPNITLIGLPNGQHSITVWANDIYDNWISRLVYFTVEETPPPTTKPPVTTPPPTTKPPVTTPPPETPEPTPPPTTHPPVTTVPPTSPPQTTPPPPTNTVPPTTQPPTTKPPETTLPPTTQPPIVDSDGDGWSDSHEISAGTDPEDKDTDDDGYWDPSDPNPLNPKIPEKVKEAIEKQTGFIERITNILEKIFNKIFRRNDD